MKVFVEELGITAEVDDGLSDAELRDTIQENLLAPTKFKDKDGNRMNKFEKMQDEENQELRQQAIEETGIIEEYKPNFYEKHIRQPLQEQGLLPSILQPNMRGVGLKKPSDPSKVDMFVLSGMSAFTGLDPFSRHTAEQLEGADPTLNIPIPFVGDAKIAPLRFAGGLAGGVGSLMTARGALTSLTSLPKRTAQVTAFAAKFNLTQKVARFVPGAIMSGATFGTTAFVHETMKQAQAGKIDIEKIGTTVLKNTGLGAGLGILAPTAVTIFPKNVIAQQSTAITGASAIGFMFAKSQGADNADALLHGAIFGLFEAIGGNNFNKIVTKNIFENVTYPTVGRYIKLKNPNIENPTGLAKRMFEEMAGKAGFKNMEEVYNNKNFQLEMLEAWNQKAINSIDKMTGTKPKPKEKTPELGKPAEPTEGKPVEPTGKPAEPKAQPVGEAQPEPVVTKLKPVSPELQGAVNIAKNFDNLEDFQSELMLPENVKLVEPVRDLAVSIAIEEFGAKLKLDPKAAEVLLKEVLPLAGNVRTEAIMKLTGMNNKQAKDFEGKALEITRQVQVDALKQIFERGQLEKSRPTPEGIPISPTSGVVITPEAQQLFELMKGQLGKAEATNVVNLAEKIATVLGKNSIDIDDLAKASELKNEDGFVEQVIRDFGIAGLNPETAKNIERVFGEDVAGRLQQANEQFKKAMEKDPTVEEANAVIEKLVKKFAKPKKVRKAKPKLLSKKEKTSKPKKFKNTDALEKNENGDVVLPYKVTIDGVEQEVLASSEFFNNLQPVEFIELVKIMRTLTGKIPRVAVEKKNEPGLRGWVLPITDKETGKVDFVELALNPVLFERGNENLLAIVMAHEFGHLVDIFEPQTINDNNLLNKLKQVSDGMVKIFEGMVIQDVKPSTPIDAEMKKLSFSIRPMSPHASPKHKAYRNKPEEIYADFISALFFSPGMVEKIAPKSLKIFLDHMDNNMELKKAYVAIQQMLNGAPAEVFEARSDIMREWFIKGEELLKKFAEEKALRRKVKAVDLQDALVDSYGPILRKEDIDATNGILPPLTSPSYALQENQLADNGWWKAVANVQRKMLDPLSEAGIDELTVAEYVFLTRVVGNPAVTADDFSGLFEAFDSTEQESIKKFIEQLVEQGFNDRKDLANPGGFAPESAKKQLEFMKEKMGKEAYALMEKHTKVFRDEVWNIVSDGVDAGIYPRGLKHKLEKNKDFYATFAVLNYLTGHIPAGLIPSAGTLAPVANPINATLLKMVSVVRWSSQNRAALATVRMVQRVNKKKIKPAGRMPKKIKPDEGIITVYQDGKPKFYVVEKEVADAFNGSSTSTNILVNWLDGALGNKMFKHIFITYNLSFAFLTNVQRDFKANLITLSAFNVKKPIRTLFKAMLRNNAVAKQFTKGELNELTQEMIDTKAMGKPFTDFSFHLSEDPVTRTLKELEMLKGGPAISKLQTDNPILKPAQIFMNWIKFVGSKNEVLSKIAMYDIMKDKITDDKKRAMFTRRFAGTPDFRAGGTVTQTTNTLFLFSNIQIQDVRRNLELSQNPKTKSGYWRAILQYEVLPKFIMKLLALGLGGAYLKSLYDDISEYDKTNYTVIPLGRAWGEGDDRVIYMRLVPSGVGGIIAGLFWKTLGVFDEKKQPLKDFVQALDYAGGQMPGVAPGADLIGAFAQYATGHNPYDAFYGDNVVPDTEFDAGGIASHNKMALWSLKKAGLSQYMSGLTSKDERDNWFEATIRHTPGLNSLIKISDRGLVERVRDINDRIRKESAQDRLNRLEIFDDAKDRINAGEEFNDVFKDVRKEYFDSPQTKTKEDRTGVVTLRGQLIAFNLKESDEAPVVILMNTPTTEGKAKILSEIIKPRMEDKRFQEFKRNMLRFDVISREVLIKMKTLDKENK
jgi:hypothetical protein